jgi:rhamnogalacturonyl hydrolase YesR
MKILVGKSLNQLSYYVEKENYQGWDPYDGLNSKLFRATPFNKIAFARLLWIQLFKRSPINLRRLAMIPAGFNPKGIALFLEGYCNLYSANPEEEYLEKIRWLSKKLLELQSPGYSGTCWGYNFDWQARGELFFPAFTPTVVATTFAAAALFRAYEITDNEEYLENALSSADFVIKDLKRTKKEKGFLFSYSPKYGNNAVYNASLMGSKLLSYCYYYTNNEKYKELAHQSVAACVAAQKEDGSWIYGELPIQNWIDSFHTGYNLECLNDYAINCNDHQFDKEINHGFKYYVQNFFTESGLPKYYNNRIYPVDIHCSAQLLVTLAKLNRFAEYKELANKVLNWTIENMQDDQGYFYYQKNKYYTNKIPYMRWSQAFMFYGISYFLKETKPDYQ